MLAAAASTFCLSYFVESNFDIQTATTNFYRMIKMVDISLILWSSTWAVLISLPFYRIELAFHSQRRELGAGHVFDDKR